MTPPLSSPSPLPDDEARRAIREDLDATLVVEAAAGTGKTTMLVSRIIAVLRRGKAGLDRIAAVTFTEKAAGEMKLRLRAGIERVRIDPTASAEERARLDAALAQLEVARIGTIHALCADLLREWPVEARVDPLFDVAPEEEAERLFEQAFDAWFQDALRDPPEGVRRLLRRRSRAGRAGSGPRAALREAAWRLIGHRDFPASFRRDDFDRNGAIDDVIADLTAIGPLWTRADRDDDWLAQGLRKIDRFIAELERREHVRGRDHDGLEAELAEMLRWKEWKWKGAGAYGRGLQRAEIVARRDAVKAKLEALCERAGAGLAACLQRELSPLVARYDALKARAGKLDFLDLLLKARDLVRTSRPARAALQARIQHLFVDEFQDTDPLQAEILLLLAADDPDETSAARARPAPGKLFLVGDPKQSIYRFRRADVALYESIKERLVNHGARVLYLTTSFRSAPAIQDAVNAAFAPVMQGSPTGSQATYVALQKFRGGLDGQPAIVALPAPRPYAPYGKISEIAVKESLPDAVGAFIDFLVRRSGWQVTERDRAGGTVPVGARHVCLLFKRFQSYGEDVTRPYVRALEARRIPHVLVGGRSFHDREEVQAVRSALGAIESPDDELAVYATLRGPFFALGDDALLTYRQAVADEAPPGRAGLCPIPRGEGNALGPLDPLRVPPGLDADDEPMVRDVASALAVLARLHARRNRRSIADTLQDLLEATRAHAGIAIWPTGEQALANVLRVIDLGRRFDASGGTSFRAFVARLDADAASGQAGEAPVVEEGTEGVRIMTVHRAKGLEFPVVLLADPTAPSTHAQPTRHVDPERGLWAEALAGCMPADLLDHRDAVLRHDREEATRLAYVAATRARDLLVVPTLGDGSIEGWLDVLNPVVYPASIDRRGSLPAPGCPPFGHDSVLDRPARAGDADASVMPGLHYGEVGRVPVVWWDPRALDLGKEPEGGLRQQRILAADEGGAVSEEGAVAHAAWLEHRTALLAAGSLPTLPTETVTEIATREGRLAAAGVYGPRSARTVAVDIAATDAPRAGRPRGKRFGTLVHAVLAEIDLAADEGAVRAVARAQGRLLGAPDAEIEAAAAAALAALAHPLLRRAAASDRDGACRRETPVLLRGHDGALVEGVIDLAFREVGPDGPHWTVVDFKTDAELDGRRDKYETQVLLYVEAIRDATAEPARGVLLSV